MGNNNLGPMFSPKSEQIMLGNNKHGATSAEIVYGSKDTEDLQGDPSEIRLRKGRKQIAWMNLSGSGSTRFLEVAPEHQRKGAATEMWNIMKSAAESRPDSVATPKHSAARSEQGGRFCEVYR